MLMDRKIPPVLRRLGRFALDAGNGFLDLLYPPLCLHCRARIGARSLLCRACRTRLEPLDADATKHVLERLDSKWIDRAVAVWYFDKGSPLQDVQHALKYGNRPVCGRWMGSYLGRACMNALDDLPDVVVPIPLHRTRLLERGYNQSETIADAVAQVLNRPMVPQILSRTRATVTQTHLTRAERRQNLAGAFDAAPGDLVTRRHVLVIDDVMTTGATFEAAAIALKQQGAARVTAAAAGLARN